MCGILTIASSGPVELSDGAVARMRDEMDHRGPDDAGVVRRGSVVLAHRRLAVMDPSEAGHQPMATPDGRFAIVYNGELYNEAEIRRDLGREGVGLRTACDTEAVLLALATWGPGALDRLRGMYALALHDARENTLLLARDPLGIKPLYVWRGAIGGRPSLVAASEIPAIFGHPEVSPAPDRVGIAAYLMTLRTSIGRRTMFAGVETLLPGERAMFDLGREGLGGERAIASVDLTASRNASPAEIGRAVEDSVLRHLRSDVPMCCLLSGGVDSSIIAAIAREHAGRLQTYCAGARDDDGPESPDFAPARLMAHKLGTEHAEVPITRSLFLGRWPELVGRSGSPLSTPNEVAIHEVARVMREAGFTVTLSGEGADELFGGYTEPLGLAQGFVDEGRTDGGAFQLDTFAWMSREARSVLLNRSWLLATGDGEALLSNLEDPVLGAYRAIWDGCIAPERADEPLLPHVRFHRHVNLAGLLRRLDSMTMLASIEGRTPLADPVIGRLADGLPVERRYRPGTLGKLALREAFVDRLPAQIVERPKASFPLPFERWIGDAGAWLRESPFAGEVFSPAAIGAVAEDPSAHWRLAWPMINVAMWGDRWF